MHFEVIRTADKSGYANGNGIRFDILGTIAIISNFQLTTCSRKHVEHISHAHKVSLSYKLLTWNRGSDDLSIGFERDCERR